MKKFMSLILAVMLVLAMAVPAMAEDATGYTITAPDNGHTYEVYQIFTGDLYDGVLSNVKWGKNGTGTQGATVDEATLNALVAVTDGTNTEKLAVIEKYAKLTAENAYATIAPNGKLENVPAGYYLIKDVDGALTNKDDVYTTYIVKVVGNVTISPKSVKPTIDKQVWDEASDDDEEPDENWGETADHAINESFQFKLIAKLPADPDYDAYKTYKVEFHDTMAKGITYESIESVTVDGVIIENYQTSENLVPNTAGKLEWSLTIADVKGINGVNLTDGAEIVVIYNAHLNEEAQIGNKDDNKNTVYLKYPNNPNAGGENEMGMTEEDTVWVFTYEMPNTKVDGNNAPLAGAGFRLYTDAACTNEVALIYDATMAAYRPTKGNEVGVEMISAADTGKFDIKGLDVGTYYLKETTTPDGYNTCDVVTVEITATHAEAETKATAATTITMKMNGAVSENNQIQNNKGATLPETGGMGTTVIYVAGGLLVAAAVIVMISRRRREA